jgi:uncharacterized protein YkwD
MTPRAVTLRVLAVALVAAVALTATPAPAATPAETKYAKRIFTIVNDTRADHGRVQLSRNKCMQRFANRHAERMADQQRAFHQNLTKLGRVCGLSRVSENIWFTSGGPEDVVSGWMSSPDGHGENLLLRKWRITGVAAREAGDIWWVSQVFGRKN